VLREEHTLRLFENRALKRIFGPKGEYVLAGLRKLYNEHHNLYYGAGIAQWYSDGLRAG
jgi:hypothetical protein